MNGNATRDSARQRGPVARAVTAVRDRLTPRTGRAVLLPLVALALAVTSLPAVAASGGHPRLPVQYGLGDSWAAGQGADPGNGYMALAHEGLLEELDCRPAATDRARDGCRHLQLVNLARGATPTQPGVTTQLVLSEQIPVLEPVLAARNHDADPRNDVEVIVLTVGGNDVNSPILNACLGGFDLECITTINAQVTDYGGRLDTILAELRQLAGPDTTIVITTYDNALAYCDRNAIPGAAQLGAIALEGLPGVIPAGLNDVIRSTAADHDVRVADVFGLLGDGMWVGGEDCLHPNAAGHSVIAAEVVAAGRD